MKPLHPLDLNNLDGNISRKTLDKICQYYTQRQETHKKITQLLGYWKETRGDYSGVVEARAAMLNAVACLDMFDTQLDKAFQILCEKLPEEYEHAIG